MIALKNILVATDFGEAADAALAYGRELARTFGATLHVLHVADDVYVRLGGDAYVGVLPELQQDIEAAARQQLDALLVDNDPVPLPARRSVVTSSAPAAAIVDYARDADIDLIVVGTHGRGAVAHLLMGSVAERVVRTAPCPVLTVRHPEHEFVMPDALGRDRAGLSHARRSRRRCRPAIRSTARGSCCATAPSPRFARSTPADRDAIRRFFHDLSPESRRNRFFTVGRTGRRARRPALRLERRPAQRSR